MRMRLARKKSQNTRYIKKTLQQNKTQGTGSAGKGLDPNLPLLGLRTRESAGTSNLKAPSGGVKYPGQVEPTTRYLILSPPIPKEKTTVNSGFITQFFSLN